LENTAILQLLLYQLHHFHVQGIKEILSAISCTSKAHILD